jgi:(4S)-4-hydroxy-5-phosphonooxypentane-2,3-dione isomerase
MMTVIATLKVKPGSEKAFREAADKMVAHVKANEPGTLTYLLNRSTSDPTKFVFYEVYADQAAFAAHGGSEPMQQFFGAVGTLLDGRPDIHMYEELGGKK